MSDNYRGDQQKKDAQFSALYVSPGPFTNTLSGTDYVDARGAQGPQGPEGPAGVRGTTGERGRVGPQGAQGLPGIGISLLNPIEPEDLTIPGDVVIFSGKDGTIQWFNPGTHISSKQHPQGGEDNTRVAIGLGALEGLDGERVVSIGFNAAGSTNTTTGDDTVALGYSAANPGGQNNRAIAIGTDSGSSTEAQPEDSIAIGLRAGRGVSSGAIRSISLGTDSVKTGEHSIGAIAIGNMTGGGRLVAASSYAISIGEHSGAPFQEESAIALGRLAGSVESLVGELVPLSEATLSQGAHSICIGDGSGSRVEAVTGAIGSDNIAIGKLAGAVPSGALAGVSSADNVALGPYAGYGGQAGGCVAVGYRAGSGIYQQAKDSVAMGRYAGSFEGISYGSGGWIDIGSRPGSGTKSPGDHSVFIGGLDTTSSAGYSLGRGEDSIYIGYMSSLEQGNIAKNSICIGAEAAKSGTSDGVIAIGYKASGHSFVPGAKAVMIGASSMSPGAAGYDSVAIGYGSVCTADHGIAIGHRAVTTASSVVLKSGADDLVVTDPGFYVSSLTDGSVDFEDAKFLCYDTGTGEVSQRTVTGMRVTESEGEYLTVTNGAVFADMQSNRIDIVGNMDVYGGRTITVGSAPRNTVIVRGTVTSQDLRLENLDVKDVIAESVYINEADICYLTVDNVGVMGGTRTNTDVIARSQGDTATLIELSGNISLSAMGIVIGDLSDPRFSTTIGAGFIRTGGTFTARKKLIADTLSAGVVGGTDSSGQITQGGDLAADIVSSRYLTVTGGASFQTLNTDRVCQYGDLNVATGIVNFGVANECFGPEVTFRMVSDNLSFNPSGESYSQSTSRTMYMALATDESFKMPNGLENPWQPSQNVYDTDGGAGEKITSGIGWLGLSDSPADALPPFFFLENLWGASEGAGVLQGYKGKFLATRRPKSWSTDYSPDDGDPEQVIGLALMEAPPLDGSAYWHRRTGTDPVTNDEFVYLSQTRRGLQTNQVGSSEVNKTFLFPYPPLGGFLGQPVTSGSAPANEGPFGYDSACVSFSPDPTGSESGGKMMAICANQGIGNGAYPAFDSWQAAEDGLSGYPDNVFPPLRNEYSSTCGYSGMWGFISNQFSPDGFPSCSITGGTISAHYISCELVSAPTISAGSASVGNLGPIPEIDFVELRVRESSLFEGPTLVTETTGGKMDVLGSAHISGSLTIGTSTFVTDGTSINISSDGAYTSIGTDTAVLSSAGSTVTATYVAGERVELTIPGNVQMRNLVATRGPVTCTDADVEGELRVGSIVADVFYVQGAADTTSLTVGTAALPTDMTIQTRLEGDAVGSLPGIVVDLIAGGEIRITGTLTIGEQNPPDLLDWGRDEIQNIPNSNPLFYTAVTTSSGLAVFAGDSIYYSNSSGSSNVATDISLSSVRYPVAGGAEGGTAVFLGFDDFGSCENLPPGNKRPLALSCGLQAPGWGGWTTVPSHIYEQISYASIATLTDGTLVTAFTSADEPARAVAYTYASGSWEPMGRASEGRSQNVPVSADAPSFPTGISCDGDGRIFLTSCRLRRSDDPPPPPPSSANDAYEFVDAIAVMTVTAGSASIYALSQGEAGPVESAPIDLRATLSSSSIYSWCESYAPNFPVNPLVPTNRLNDTFAIPAEWNDYLSLGLGGTIVRFRDDIPSTSAFVGGGALPASASAFKYAATSSAVPAFTPTSTYEAWANATAGVSFDDASPGWIGITSGSLVAGLALPNGDTGTGITSDLKQAYVLNPLTALMSYSLTGGASVDAYEELSLSAGMSVAGYVNTSYPLSLQSLWEGITVAAGTVDGYDDEVGFPGISQSLLDGSVRTAQNYVQIQSLKFNTSTISDGSIVAGTLAAGVDINSFGTISTGVWGTYGQLQYWNSFPGLGAIVTDFSLESSFEIEPFGTADGTDFCGWWGASCGKYALYGGGSAMPSCRGGPSSLLNTGLTGRYLFEGDLAAGALLQPFGSCAVYAQFAYNPGPLSDSPLLTGQSVSSGLAAFTGTADDFSSIPLSEACETSAAGSSGTKPWEADWKVATGGLQEYAYTNTVVFGNLDQNPGSFVPPLSTDARTLAGSRAPQDNPPVLPLSSSFGNSIQPFQMNQTPLTYQCGSCGVMISNKFYTSVPVDYPDRGWAMIGGGGLWSGGSTSAGVDSKNWDIAQSSYIIDGYTTTPTLNYDNVPGEDPETEYEITSTIPNLGTPTWNRVAGEDWTWPGCQAFRGDGWWGEWACTDETALFFYSASAGNINPIPRQVLSNEGYDRAALKLLSGPVVNPSAAALRGPGNFSYAFFAGGHAWKAGTNYLDHPTTGGDTDIFKYPNQITVFEIDWSSYTTNFYPTVSILADGAWASGSANKTLDGLPVDNGPTGMGGAAQIGATTIDNRYVLFYGGWRAGKNPNSTGTNKYGTVRYETTIIDTKSDFEHPENWELTVMRSDKKPGDGTSSVYFDNDAVPLPDEPDFAEAPKLVFSAGGNTQEAYFSYAYYTEASGGVDPFVNAVSSYNKDEFHDFSFTSGVISSTRTYGTSMIVDASGTVEATYVKPPNGKIVVAELSSFEADDVTYDDVWIETELPGTELSFAPQLWSVSGGNSLLIALGELSDDSAVGASAVNTAVAFGFAIGSIAAGTVTTTSSLPLPNGSAALARNAYPEMLGIGLWSNKSNMAAAAAADTSSSDTSSPLYLGFPRPCGCSMMVGSVPNGELEDSVYVGDKIGWPRNQILLNLNTPLADNRLSLGGPGTSGYNGWSGPGWCGWGNIGNARIGGGPFGRKSPTTSNTPYFGCQWGEGNATAGGLNWRGGGPIYNYAQGDVAPLPNIYWPNNDPIGTSTADYGTQSTGGCWFTWRSPLDITFSTASQMRAWPGMDRIRIKNSINVKLDEDQECVDSGGYLKLRNPPGSGDTKYMGDPPTEEALSCFPHGYPFPPPGIGQPGPNKKADEHQNSVQIPWPVASDQTTGDRTNRMGSLWQTTRGGVVSLTLQPFSRRWNPVNRSMEDTNGDSDQKPAALKDNTWGGRFIEAGLVHRTETTGESFSIRELNYDGTSQPYSTLDSTLDNELCGKSQTQYSYPYQTGEFMIECKQAGTYDVSFQLTAAICSKMITLSKLAGDPSLGNRVTPPFEMWPHSLEIRKQQPVTSGTGGYPSDPLNDRPDEAVKWDLSERIRCITKIRRGPDGKDVSSLPPEFPSVSRFFNTWGSIKVTSLEPVDVSVGDVFRLYWNVDYWPLQSGLSLFNVYKEPSLTLCSAAGYDDDESEGAFCASYQERKTFELAGLNWEDFTTSFDAVPSVAKSPCPLIDNLLWSAHVEPRNVCEATSITNGSTVSVGCLPNPGSVSGGGVFQALRQDTCATTVAFPPKGDQVEGMSTEGTFCVPLAVGGIVRYNVVETYVNPLEPDGGNDGGQANTLAGGANAILAYLAGTASMPLHILPFSTLCQLPPNELANCQCATETTGGAVQYAVGGLSPTPFGVNYQLPVSASGTAFSIQPGEGRITGVGRAPNSTPPKPELPGGYENTRFVCSTTGKYQVVVRLVLGWNYTGVEAMNAPGFTQALTVDGQAGDKSFTAGDTTVPLPGVSKIQIKRIRNVGGGEQVTILSDADLVREAQEWSYVTTGCGFSRRKQDSKSIGDSRPTPNEMPGNDGNPGFWGVPDCWISNWVGGEDGSASTGKYTTTDDSIESSGLTNPESDDFVTPYSYTNPYPQPYSVSAGQEPQLSWHTSGAAVAYTREEIVFETGDAIEVSWVLSDPVGAETTHQGVAAEGQMSLETEKAQLNYRLINSRTGPCVLTGTRVEFRGLAGPPDPVGEPVGFQKTSSGVWESISFDSSGLGAFKFPAASSVPVVGSRHTGDPAQTEARIAYEVFTNDNLNSTLEIARLTLTTGKLWDVNGLVQGSYSGGLPVRGRPVSYGPGNFEIGPGATSSYDPPLLLNNYTGEAVLCQLNPDNSLNFSEQTIQIYEVFSETSGLAGKSSAINTMGTGPVGPWFMASDGSQVITIATSFTDGCFISGDVKTYFPGSCQLDASPPGAGNMLFMPQQVSSSLEDYSSYPVTLVTEEPGDSSSSYDLTPVQLGGTRTTGVSFDPSDPTSLTFLNYDGAVEIREGAVGGTCGGKLVCTSGKGGEKVWLVDLSSGSYTLSYIGDLDQGAVEFPGVAFGSANGMDFIYFAGGMDEDGNAKEEITGFTISPGSSGSPQKVTATSHTLKVDFIDEKPGSVARSHISATSFSNKVLFGPGASEAASSETDERYWWINAYDVSVAGGLTVNEGLSITRSAAISLDGEAGWPLTGNFTTQLSAFSNRDLLLGFAGPTDPNDNNYQTNLFTLCTGQIWGSALRGNSGATVGITDALAGGGYRLSTSGVSRKSSAFVAGTNNEGYILSATSERVSPTYITIYGLKDEQPKYLSPDDSGDLRVLTIQPI